MPLGIEVALNTGDFVLDGDPAPTPKGAEPHPIFGRRLVAKRLHGSICHLVRRRPRPTRHCVRCGLSYPRKKFTPTPQKFLAHVYFGQMAGRLKTPLGTEVAVGPGHIVLDGVPAPAKGAQQPPSFWPMSVVATVAHLSYC